MIPHNAYISAGKVCIKYTYTIFYHTKTLQKDYEVDIIKFFVQLVLLF